MYEKQQQKQPIKIRNTQKLLTQISEWSKQLGFDEIGIAKTTLPDYEAHLLRWLKDGMHGDMHYMQTHGNKRSHPNELVPGIASIISVRMNYLPEAKSATTVLDDPQAAYIARYALGRDYHKLMRKRLQKLAIRIENEVGAFGYRAFVDSAPVLEKALAEQAGLGWIGKNTLVLNRNAGSYFFLGELYTDLPLPDSELTTNHCGNCQRCIEICPTQAIIEPYRLDARLCIAYLTIEHQGSIPEDLRPSIGNRVFGCDDCQIVCPWNRYAKTSSDIAFTVKNQLDDISLLELFGWTEEEFNTRTEGTVLHRLAYVRWLRNLAVGLGNANYDPAIVSALTKHKNHPSEIVREHVTWALERQTASC